MPKNWEARDKKLGARKNRMPKHGLGYVRLATQEINKRGTKAAYKVNERGVEDVD